jgi:Transmembrane secretion effector
VVGPAAGSALLLGLGPSIALLVNALIYVPLVVWLWNSRRRHAHRPDLKAPTRAVLRIGDVVAAIRDIAQHPTILTMSLLAAGAALFVGTAYQAQMPAFARDLGHGDPGVTYGLLLAADAAGALCAGISLETIGFLMPARRTVLLLAMAWATALACFALTKSYPLAVLLLFAAGFLELSFNSMAQTLVQLDAPPAIRGRMIGVYSTATAGMRTFSGLSVGFAGELIGIHYSLGISCLCVIAISLALMFHSRRTAAIAYPSSNSRMRR